MFNNAKQVFNPVQLIKAIELEKPIQLRNAKELFKNQNKSMQYSCQYIISNKFNTACQCNTVSQLNTTKQKNSSSVQNCLLTQCRFECNTAFNTGLLTNANSLSTH